MGEVYRARDARLKRQVAIKILPPLLAADPDRLARLQREAEVLASLNHPHIAAIYGLEEADGVKALVMELVEGPTLAERIARGPIPLDEALPVAKQITEALEAAHEKGIIHRDLKPANIKLRADGMVKVLDFGLAKSFEQTLPDDLTRAAVVQSPAATVAGVIMGTAAYMSPEQARGKAVDKRTDIWAFGCVLFEMLGGRRPFEGETLTDTIAAIVKNEPDWRALPLGTPAGVRSVIARCLKKDPAERLRDVADARLQLEDVVDDPDPAAAASKRALPRREWAGWIAALLLLGVGAVSCAAARARRAAPQPCQLADRPAAKHVVLVANQRDGRCAGFRHVPRRHHVGFRRGSPRSGADPVAAFVGSGRSPPARRHGRRAGSVLVARQPLDRVRRRRKAEEDPRRWWTGSDPHRRVDGFPRRKIGALETGSCSAAAVCRFHR